MQDENSNSRKIYELKRYIPSGFSGTTTGETASEKLDTFYTAEQLSEGDKAHAVKVTNHFFTASGKGLRPALVLLAAQLTGADGNLASLSQAVIQFATVVELFHSASLVHDDVIAHAPSRRNQVSLNERYGDHIAVGGMN